MTSRMGKLLSSTAAILTVSSLLTACGDETIEDGLAGSASPETLAARSSRSRGRDNKAPVITITSPTTAGSYNSTAPTITLAGRSKDNNQISSVIWQNDHGDKGDAQGTTSWWVNGLLLYPGDNTVTVTVIDASANSSSTSILVTYIPDEEPLVLAEPPPEPQLLNEPLVSAEPPPEPSLLNEPPVLAEPPPEPPLLNEPPVLYGQPQTAVVQDAAYGFTPTAVDPDGDRLIFSITNKPEWADFDTTSGTLSGVPGQADLGTTYGVLITVSDGTSEASLPSFDLTVDQVAMGSVTLAWNPPTENIDGTPVSDLAGYKIYYGSSPGEYSTEIIVDNPGITRYMVDNLSPNHWYFAVTAYDLAGHESEATYEASTTIQ
jgi:hypothetical protein